MRRDGLPSLRLRVGTGGTSLPSSFRNELISLDIIRRDEEREAEGEVPVVRLLSLFLTSLLSSFSFLRGCVDRCTTPHKLLYFTSIFTS